MDQTTSIDAADVTISTRNNSIKALVLQDNKKIFFLPVRVGEKFPNLQGYTAYGCSIKVISRENFETLGNLEYLELGGNQIETISSDTFSSLKNLENLMLCKKIKFI